MKLLYVNKLPFFTYLIILRVLQKFTNVGGIHFSIILTSMVVGFFVYL